MLDSFFSALNAAFTESRRVSSMLIMNFPYSSDLAASRILRITVYGRVAAYFWFAIRLLRLELILLRKSSWVCWVNAG